THPDTQQPRDFAQVTGSVHAVTCERVWLPRLHPDNGGLLNTSNLAFRRCAELLAVEVVAAPIIQNPRNAKGRVESEESDSPRPAELAISGVNRSLGDIESKLLSIALLVDCQTGHQPDNTHDDTGQHE